MRVVGGGGGEGGGGIKTKIHCTNTTLTGNCEMYGK